MRHLLRFLLLACFLLPASAVVVTTTVSTDQGYNQVTQAAINATENVVTVSVVTPRTIMFVSDVAWLYRSTTANTATQIPVVAGQSLTLTYNASTTFYHTRSTADGTLYIMPLLPSGPPR